MDSALDRFLGEYAVRGLVERYGLDPTFDNDVGKEEDLSGNRLGVFLGSGEQHKGYSEEMW